MVHDAEIQIIEHMIEYALRTSNGTNDERDLSVRLLEKAMDKAAAAGIDFSTTFFQVRSRITTTNQEA